jgi:phosphomevalonate kinase
VGSGFDVACAVYGSCIYKRFSPDILAPLLSSGRLFSATFREELRALVNSGWQMQVEPFKLPAGMRVVMGDVNAGSETPSMVRKVLKWKAENPSGERDWKDLAHHNEWFVKVFQSLRDYHAEKVIIAIRDKSFNPSLEGELLMGVETLGWIFKVRCQDFLAR